MRLRTFFLWIFALAGPASASSAATAPAPPAGANRAVSENDPHAQQNFTIINNTGHNVTALNVSPTTERSWGPNILGSDKLGNGESAEITFPRSATQCKWDIRATYDDGTDTDMRDVDLCEVATVTLTPD